MAKSKQVSILVDEELLAEIDAHAERLGRSRNWVINRRLEPGILPMGSAGGSEKKSRGFSMGGGATEGGGDPCLPPLGKAQFSVEVARISEILVPPKLEGIKSLCVRLASERQDWQNSMVLSDALEAAAVDKEFAEFCRVAGISTLAGERASRCPKVIPAEDGADYFVAPRAGLVEPQGGWDVCGTCGQVHTEGEYFNHNFVSRKKSAADVPVPGYVLDNMSRARGVWSGPTEMPIWALKWNQEIETGTPRGLKNCSPKLLEEIKEAAKTDGAAALVLHQSGIELDREILVRWGLAENYKPKLEAENVAEVQAVASEKEGGEADGKRRSVLCPVSAKTEKGEGKIDGDVEPGEAAGENRRNSKAVQDRRDGDESLAVGVGKPGVDMEALRDICAGNIPLNPIPEQIAQMSKAKELIYGEFPPDPHEVDLCGFKSYNEEDGENYVCGKEVHGPKVKHGEWIKV